jgi:hypothetical protein
VADRVTEVPTANASVQSVPQLIPAGALVTVPVLAPAPAFVTYTSYVLEASRGR